MAKILIIDDMFGVRHSLSAALKLEGHEVVEAGDGAEGISCLESDCFDLLITDILMPEKDGSEVIMRARELHSRLPILAISGGGTAISVDKALEVAEIHADAILKKPFDRSELIEIVNKILS